jgi:hypothetical protein
VTIAAPVLLAEHFQIPWWGSIIFFSILLIWALVARTCKPGFVERTLQRDWTARGMGLLFILFGCLAAFVLPYPTVVQARQHEPRVTVRYGFAAIPSLLFLAGAIKLVAGKNASKFLVTRHGQEMTLLQRATCTVMVVLCLGLEFGLWKLFESWGYKHGW